MVDLDQIVGRLIQLEDRYYELQSKYHELIHSYETLKAEHENCTGHRNEPKTRQDLGVRNEEH